MKYAFVGDLVLQGIDKKPEYIFGDFKDYLKKYNIKLCLNLESPFIDKGALPLKQKNILCNSKDKINYINYLSPFLINLSNNHINDYGNHSCIKTFNILKDNSHYFYGVGYSSNKENIIVDNNNKIIHLAFTTRSTDFTGSKLFAENDFIGPYSPDIKQLELLKKDYEGYTIIVNIHWGIEDIKYPEPEKRKLAYELIDNGADIIIGSHPHIIQPYELYKNKYIIYSLGNFYFNDIKVVVEEKEITRYLPKHRKQGLVPIFNFTRNKNPVIYKILKVEISDDKKLNIKKDYNLKQLSIMTDRYERIFPIYLKLSFVIYKLKKILLNPRIIVAKLIRTVAFIL